MLPSVVNGLVLLQHISHHLESGLGLRQILDWMMYVNAELTDELWNREFEEAADKIGLKKLAMVTTRMCQIYLGLPRKITWCRDVQQDLCDRLMAYVMNQGNFGRKNEESSKTVYILYTLKHPTAFFKLMQGNGCRNWKLLEKHPYLKSLAWMYQLCRWIRKGLRRDHAVAGLLGDFRKTAGQDVFLDQLGVRRRKRS